MSANDGLPARVDAVFDGGNLDCGSGLVLLIREHMSRVPIEGILELRSSEPTVALDLPPWCGMVGHTLLGSRKENGATAYFIRKGGTERAQREEDALEEDKRKAREYLWRLRSRSNDGLKSTVYCRNFSFPVGQPASFEEKDANPSAVEYLLGALAGALCTAFRVACSQRNIAVDDIEISVQGRIHNILAHLGIEKGDPSLAAIDLTCYASTFADPATVREAWDVTLSRCPISQTLKKGVAITTKMNII
jgi:uncharacterized OsmC-like protein/TusA-related sulfurtransferase